MSEESKRLVKEAQQFYKEVNERSKEYQAIPDKKLGEKIKKVQETSEQVVKHIQERSE